MRQFYLDHANRAEKGAALWPSACSLGRAARSRQKKHGQLISPHYD